MFEMERWPRNGGDSGICGFFIFGFRSHQLTGGCVPGPPLLFADMSDGDRCNPGTAAEGARAAGIEDGDGIEVVLVDEIGELAEPGSGNDDIGGGKGQGQPLRRVLVTAGAGESSAGRLCLAALGWR